jgi:hypothetical protein
MEATRHCWPKSVPNTTAIRNVDQIVYTLGSENNGIISVLSQNIYDKKKPAPAEWTRIPSAYSVHFRRIQYRIRLYIVCLQANFAGSDIAANNMIKRYLVYTDRVSDAFLEDAMVANAEKRMSPSWTSGGFDAFLAIESFVRVHIPDHIDSYMRQNEIDLTVNNDLDDDHWIEYANTMDIILLGDHFNWDVHVLSSQCDMTQVCDFVREALMGCNVKSVDFVDKIPGMQIMIIKLLMIPIYVPIAILSSLEKKKKNKKPSQTKRKRKRKRKDVSEDVLDEDLESIRRLLEKKKMATKRRILSEDEDESGHIAENMDHHASQIDMEVSKKTFEDTQSSTTSAMQGAADNLQVEGDVDMPSREDVVGEFQQMEKRQVEKKEIGTSSTNEDGITAKTSTINDEALDTHPNTKKGKGKKAPAKKRGRPARKCTTRGKAGPPVEENNSDSAGTL